MHKFSRTLKVSLHALSLSLLVTSVTPEVYGAPPITREELDQAFALPVVTAHLVETKHRLSPAKTQDAQQTYTTSLKKRAEALAQMRKIAPTTDTGLLNTVKPLSAPNMEAFLKAQTEFLRAENNIVRTKAHLDHDQRLREKTTQELAFLRDSTRMVMAWQALKTNTVTNKEVEGKQFDDPWGQPYEDTSNSLAVHTVYFHRAMHPALSPKITVNLLDFLDQVHTRFTIAQRDGDWVQIPAKDSINTKAADVLQCQGDETPAQFQIKMVQWFTNFLPWTQRFQEHQRALEEKLSELFKLDSRIPSDEADADAAEAQAAPRQAQQVESAPTEDTPEESLPFTVLSRMGDTFLRLGVMLDPREGAGAYLVKLNSDKDAFENIRSILADKIRGISEDLRQAKIVDTVVRKVISLFEDITEDLSRNGRLS